MKKTFLLCCLLLCVCLALGAAAAETTVYVADGGSGDGLTAAAPLGDLTAAYNALGADGGEIVIVGKYTLDANFTEPAHTGVVTLTQEVGSTSYRTADGSGLIGGGKRFILSGPTTFRNFTLRSTGGEFMLLVARFHPIVFDTGIECLGFGDFSYVHKGVAILGGAQYGADGVATDDLDTHITVKSGEVVLVGFSRQVKKAYTGMAHIDISGGKVHNIYFGAVNGGSGGDVDLNITGGTFVGNWFATSAASVVNGNCTVKITGGDFEGFGTADFAVTGSGHTSTVDISALSADAIASLTPKFSNYTTLVTNSSSLTTKVANEVFLSGSFTDSKGTTIPYRYYLPEGYATSGETYPVFLYMHGNGSRGNDNTSQLTTNGAALNTAVLNSGHPCIMIAPQCPAAPNEWVDHTKYPGSDAFAADFADGALENMPYLYAAMELLNDFIENRNLPVDTSRIYVTGSSNGGGATWAMTALHPRVFAAAVPLAGTGHSDYPVTPSGANALAARYLNTPIWTFHGDADITLSISGTNGLVSAIRAAGGTKVKYTVIEGGTHNIWPTAAATDGLVDWIFAQKNDNYFNTLMGAVAPEYDPLDANKDGKVDIIDVLFMLEKMMAGSGDYTLATVVKTLGQLAGT